MSTLTEYWFNDSFFNGQFSGVNQPFGGWAWVSRTGLSRATLSWIRPDNEIIVDIGSQLNNPLILGQVDRVLAGQADRTSGLSAKGVFWSAVPYNSRQPGRHAPSDMLVRISFGFHIGTPCYCTDADGTISYYVLFFLNSSGTLQATVDGYDFTYTGGNLICTGAINDALNAALPGGSTNVQNVLNAATARFSGQRFSKLYFLPGNGTRTAGNFNGNADTNVALAILPA